MGAEASIPKPGTKMQVIGAGLSRTGTASFSEALRILLDAPVYHGGTQIMRGRSAAEMGGWMDLINNHWPVRSAENEKAAQSLLSRRTDGFAAVADVPVAQLVPELLNLYPDAVVICTVRDPVTWERSIAQVSNAASMWFLRLVLLPVPRMRYFTGYVHALRKQNNILYGGEEPQTRVSYQRHMEWLKRVVPPEKLFFFNVSDGWEPLCKALAKEVPNVAFPRVNDGKAIEQLSKDIVVTGLARWVGIVVTLGIASVAYHRLGLEAFQYPT